MALAGSPTLTRHSLGHERLQTKPLNAPAIRIENFDFHAAMFDSLAGSGQTAEEFDNGAADGSAFGLGNERNADSFFDGFQFDASGHDVDTLSLLDDFLPVRTRFVMNLTDNLF